MKRILRIALVVLGVLAFTGFFAFSTFLFNPFEGAYAPDVSTLVPRDVDLFVARADLERDFDAELRLRRADELAKGPFGKVAELPALADARAKYDEVRTEVSNQLANLPIRTNPLEVFGGSDLALAAYFDRQGPGSVEWAAYGRGNWMAKLAYAALEKPSWFGLEKQGFSTSDDGEVITLTGGQLTQPLCFTRISDVLVVSNTSAMCAAAKRLERERAENSFGMSARYSDQILEHANDEDDLEIYVRSDDLPRKLGADGPLPDPNSVDFGEALAGRILSLGAVSEIAGALGLDEGLVSLRLEGGWRTDALTSEQKRIYRHRPADQRDIARTIGEIAPADSGLVFYIETDLGELLRLAVASAERALIDNLETEILNPIFGYARVDTFIADLEATFRDRVGLIVRANDFAKEKGDPPNDGRPTVCWALVLWIEDTDRLYHPDPGKAGLLERLEDSRNAARLGLQGRTPEEPGIYINEVQGWKITEYWSPLVKGTGHVATGVNQDVFVVTNHYKMPSLLFSTASSGSSRRVSLADRPEFAGMFNTGLPSLSAMLWLDPSKMEDDLRAMMRTSARDEIVDSIDWSVERPRIEKKVVAERFPGEIWGNLSPDVELQLEEYVRPAINEFQQNYVQERLPGKIAEIDGRLDLLLGIARALLEIRFDAKDFQLDARVVPAAPGN
ncbi:MAG: hypothetical protein R3F34_13670 [Planctomycetota bacterium]